MKKRRFLFSTVLVVAIMVFLNWSQIGRIAFYRNTSGIIPTVTSSSIADTEFHNEMGNIDINSGISIQLAIQPQKEDKNISFSVLNNSTETVIFPNQGFGINLYRFDSPTNKWLNVKLSHSPEKKPKELPAGINKLDFRYDNIWTILGTDLEQVQYKQLRIYISGIGAESKKNLWSIC